MIKITHLVNTCCLYKSTASFTYDLGAESHLKHKYTCMTSNYSKHDKIVNGEERIICDKM